MVEIEIRNFQSIEHGVVTVDRFTAITGRSNIGKSALVRAVKAALTGASVSSFVRHGPQCLRKLKQAKTCKCFASVHMTGPGLDLLWEKGDAINRYTYNGVVYDKAEKGTPEFLSPAFLPVKIADQSELLQVADQFSPIFLLNKTGGAVADLLSDVAQLDRINIAMRMAEKDRKEIASTRKVRDKDLADIEARLVDYARVDELEREVSRVEASLSRVEALGQEVMRVDDFLRDTGEVQARIEVLEQGLAVPVPDPVALREAYTAHRKVEGWCVRLATQKAELTRLAAVEQVVIPDKATLQATFAKHTTIAAWHRRLVVFKDLFAAYKPIEALPPLNPKPLIEKRAALLQVETLLRKHEALVSLVQGMEARYEALVAEERLVHDEIEALGAVCPTCDRPLGAA